MTRTAPLPGPTWSRLALASWLCACAEPHDTGAPPDSAATDSGAAPSVASQLVPLDDARLLRRLSLDLRGTLPTLDELDQVAADPEAVWTLRDAFMADPRFEERMVYLLNERWHMRLDQFDVDAQEFGYTNAETYAFDKSVGEEALRLAARIAAEDRPWTDVVTVDFSMADDIIGHIHPVDYGDDDTGWHEVHYDDGRPPAGVLSTNGFMWRFPTDPFNQGRSRAAAISRLFVCSDLLDREVSFTSLDFDSDADTSALVRSNPYCLACHSAIEPIAASLYGFHWLSQYSVAEMIYYHPERELMGEEELGVEPAWFGQPVASLEHLGLLVAADPRFDACAVETMTEGLWRRRSDLGDSDAQALALDAFLAGDRRMTALITHITEAPEYRAGDFTEAATQDLLDRHLVVRLLTPDQVRDALEDLTGFTMWVDGHEVLDADEHYGFRVLAGGVDGNLATWPQQVPGLTWAAVYQRYAESVAAEVVAGELVDGDAETAVLGEVGLDDTPGDAAFDATLRQLWRRLFGVEPADDDLAAVSALWEQVDQTDGPEAAWAAVLTALLRSPRFLAY